MRLFIFLPFRSISLRMFLAQLSRKDKCPPFSTSSILSIPLAMALIMNEFIGAPFHDQSKRLHCFYSFLHKVFRQKFWSSTFFRVNFCYILLRGFQLSVGLFKIKNSLLFRFGYSPPKSFKALEILCLCALCSGVHFKYGFLFPDPRDSAFSN